MLGVGERFNVGSTDGHHHITWSKGHLEVLYLDRKSAWQNITVAISGKTICRVTETRAEPVTCAEPVTRAERVGFPNQLVSSRRRDVGCKMKLPPGGL